jgi:hypothetical protein
MTWGKYCIVEDENMTFQYWYETKEAFLITKGVWPRVCLLSNS